MAEITILLGSNISPETNVPRALALLQQFGRIVRASHLWETPPIACKKGERFYNAIIVLESQFSHTAWKANIVQTVEGALDRIRDPLDKCAPRTIDLDLLEIPRQIDKLPFISQLLAESRGETPRSGADMVKVCDRSRLICNRALPGRKVVEEGGSHKCSDSAF